MSLEWVPLRNNSINIITIGAIATATITLVTAIASAIFVKVISFLLKSFSIKEPTVSTTKGSGFSFKEVLEVSPNLKGIVMTGATSKFVDSTGTMHIVGELRNDGTKTLRCDSNGCNNIWTKQQNSRS
ncbi:MAG: hypothetical protein ACJ704_06865 [Nitrososphaeraceae archaeon]